MLTIVWTGTDGSRWDLLNGPVRLAAAGVQGFGLPELDEQVKQTALMDGQVLQGWKVKPRNVFLPLRFDDVANTDVEVVQRAFWKSCALGASGTLTVTDASGAVRSIALRVQDDGGLAYSLDPYYRTDVFGVNFIADDPWWYGPTRSTVFSLGTDTQNTFFNNGAGAPQFYILRSVANSSSTLTNPGEQPAWITWNIAGPMTAFRIGVNSRYISGSFTVASGSTLTIDTNPTRQVAFLNSTKVTRQLTEVDFAPIAASATAPVDIFVNGTGTVTALFRPKYSRAF